MEYTPITQKEKYGQGWKGEDNYKETVIHWYREQRKQKSEVVIANINDIKRIDREYREKMYTDEILHDDWIHFFGFFQGILQCFWWTTPTVPRS